MIPEPKLESDDDKRLLGILARSAKQRREERDAILLIDAEAAVHEVFILPIGKTWVVIPGELKGVAPGDHVSWAPVGIDVECVFVDRGIFEESSLRVDNGQCKSLPVKLDAERGTYVYHVYDKTHVGTPGLHGDDGNDPTIIID